MWIFQFCDRSICHLYNNTILWLDCPHFRWSCVVCVIISVSCAVTFHQMRLSVTLCHWLFCCCCRHLFVYRLIGPALSGPVLSPDVVFYVVVTLSDICHTSHLDCPLSTARVYLMGNTCNVTGDVLCMRVLQITFESVQHWSLSSNHRQRPQTWEQRPRTGISKPLLWHTLGAFQNCFRVIWPDKSGWLRYGCVLVSKLMRLNEIGDWRQIYTRHFPLQAPAADWFYSNLISMHYWQYLPISREKTKSPSVVYDAEPSKFVAGVCRNPFTSFLFPLCHVCQNARSLDTKHFDRTQDFPVVIFKCW